MKKNISERYVRAVDGSYIIDITAGKISDLYNSFDRHTPYVKKELDQDLVDYIIDSANELGNDDFIIRFDLLEHPDEAMKTRIGTSIESYFIYLKTIEIEKLTRTMRLSFIYLLVGMVIMFLSVYVNQQLEADAGLFNEVIAQGLTVAAWVSLWEALATFLINWTPYRRKIKLYQRIANASVLFPSSSTLADSAKSE